VRGARIASNELTEVLRLENQLEKGCYMVWGGEEWGSKGGESVGVGVIAMIYGVSDRWGSANGQVGGIAFGDSQIDFRTPNLIPYKPMQTS